MTRYLLKWTFGPVQHFVEAARKTQDLWVGSLLFSALMEYVIEKARTSGAEIIYPAKTNTSVNAAIASIPNVFVAVCDGAEQARATANTAQDDLFARWGKIQQQVWDNLTNNVKTVDWAKIRPQWEAQTAPDVVFDIYWAAVPWQDDISYGEAFRSLLTALEERKRLRNFSQLSHEGEKSTITGEHAALQLPGSSRRDVGNLWKQVGKRFGHKFVRTDGSERLSAVDTVKRLAAAGKNAPLQEQYGVDFNRFPSTSTIAVAPFLNAMLTRWNTEIEKTFQTCFRNISDPSINLGIADESDCGVIPYFQSYCRDDTTQRRLLKQDGDVFFAATYAVKRLQRDFGLPDDLTPQQKDVYEEQCRKAIEKLQAMIREVQGEKTDHIAPPSPYFAVLMLDGDNMGDMISNLDKQEEHTTLSQALAEFATTAVPEIVEKYPARLVYAGGDDVLALVPMDCVLLIANKLQDSFARCLKKKKCPDGHASVGICIAHHLAPLSRTVRFARAALHTAKHRYQRNSVVVTLLRRSGEQTSVGLPWQYDGGNTIDVLSELSKLFWTDKLSPTFAHLVAAEAPTLAALPRKAQQAEVRRLLKRQRANKDVLSDEKANELAESLTGLADALEKHQPQAVETLPLELRNDGPRRGMVEVSGWLMLLTFMMRGE